MNTLTWYAKGGVERPVVTCEAHRLEEYHRQVKLGRDIAGSERAVADECDVCNHLERTAIPVNPNCNERMTSVDMAALFAWVRDAVKSSGRERVESEILAAHLGRPVVHMIGRERIRLFRQFRNWHSPDPKVLVDCAGVPS